MRTESTDKVFELALPEQPGNGRAGFAFAWRRKGLVLITLLPGLGLGYLFFLQQRPVYQSSAQILIVEQRPKLPIEGVEVSSSYDARHSILISSPIVVQKAIDKHGLRQLATLRDSTDAVATLMAGLSTSGLTTAGSRTGNVIELTYVSPNQEDCPKILNAVVKAYQEFLGDLYQNVSEETNELITQAKDQLDKEITAEEEAYRKFRSEAQLLFKGKTAENVHETRLIQIESVRSEAIVEQSKLQAKIESLTKALLGGADRKVLNLMIGNVSDVKTTSITRSAVAIDSLLFPLLVEEQALLERHGRDNPKVLAIRKRIEMTKKYFANTDREEEHPEIKPPNNFEVYLESLRLQESMNEQTIEEMNRLFETERAASKLLTNDQVTDESFRAKIERKARLFDVVLKRLEEINLVKHSGGATVQLIYPPALGNKIEPSLKGIMFTSGILAVLCGLGLAFTVDAADLRYRSPDEIRDYLSVPVVGHIPAFANAPSNPNGKKTGAVAAELQSIHSPRGGIAEAYRAVRTAVYFNTRGSSHNIIQVTSPYPLDGKSTLSANLAVSIANTGKSVILIDADFRRPCCHKLFNLDNLVGMTSVIEGEIELTDAIQQTVVENLSLLTCGTLPENSSDLLTSRPFEELLDQLRGQFEMVILDTPPVLVVTDPLNVAARVDGVLMVLRLSKSARDGSRRTLDALQEVGARVLGVVVNGVDGAGSGYGGSGYGRSDYRYGGFGFGNRHATTEMLRWLQYGDASEFDESDDRGNGGGDVVGNTQTQQESDRTAHSKD